MLPREQVKWHKVCAPHWGGGFLRRRSILCAQAIRGAGRWVAYTASLPLIYLGNRHEARENDRRKHFHVIAHVR